MDLSVIEKLALKEAGLEKRPENIKIIYLDLLDFTNLKKDNIPKEILDCPVITIEKDSIYQIIVNHTILADKEYYVCELYAFQLIQLLMKTKYTNIRMNVKTNFLYRYSIVGFDAYCEYQNLLMTFKVMEQYYNKVSQKKNPYTFKTNKKIALKVIRGSFLKNNRHEHLSSLLYGIARIKNYDFNNCINEAEKASLVNEFYFMLNNPDTLTTKYFNKLGLLASNITKKSNV